MKPRVDFTEEMMLNPPKCGHHAVDWSKWRRYRMEYGFECSCPEGTIYLPQEIDPDIVEDFLNSLLTST